MKLSRRALIVGAGASGVAVGIALLAPHVRPTIVDIVLRRGTGPQKAPESIDVWFGLERSGKITLFCPKSEMGQGIHTALAQIAAEELGFDGSMTFTFGSSSVNALYEPLRLAAASLRSMLLDEARRRTGVTDLSVVGGRIHMADGTASDLTYGRILAEKRGPWNPPTGEPKLKPRAHFTRIGTSMPRVDMLAKVTGRAVYGFDARAEHMLYGGVARPPRYGARLARAALGRAASMPGVVRVVLDEAAGFAGVVCERRSQAWEAVRELNLEWIGGTTISGAELDALVTAKVSRGATLRQSGDVPGSLKQGAFLETQYRTGLAAHAHLEPLAALAVPHSQRMEIWAATQHPERVRQEVKQVLPSGFDVVVTPTYLGGGFGRKAAESPAADAARLAHAVNRPVHVGLTRKEDMQLGPFRPNSHTAFRASVSPGGRIHAVHQAVATGDIVFAVEPPFGGEATARLLGFDPGDLLGKFSPYDFGSFRVENERMALPVPTGPWRGLGLVHNVFAIESLMDELANLAGADPLQFRLAHLAQDAEGRRVARVLERAAQKAGWGTPLPRGHGRGIACCVDVHTAVAIVTELSIPEGAIKVHSVHAAVDPGLVVDPAGCILQAKGSIVMGLGTALIEDLSLANGMVQETNFDTYPIMRMAQTPSISVELLESGDVPFGMGEPVIGPVAPAVANAVFAATKLRLRQLPLRLSA
jgi:isoquinoline 1-oxidoreductase beta subunit